MSKWYALLDGHYDDVRLIRLGFASSELELTEMDGKWGLSSPTFESSDDSAEVIDTATLILGDINTALLISEPAYTALNLHGLIERRGAATHKFMLAQGASFSKSLVSAASTAAAPSVPVRTKEERLVSLISKSDPIKEIARELAVRPVTWAAMRKAFETVKGLGPVFS